MIVDRFHLSNVVFGKFYGRQYNQDMFDKIDDLVRSNSCLINTYCSPEHSFNRSKEKDRNKKYTIFDYIQLDEDFASIYQASRITKKLALNSSELSIVKMKSTVFGFICRALYQKKEESEMICRIKRGKK